MFEVSVEAEFCAAHSLSVRGTPEPLHGHNWHVTAVVAGPRLDADGLVCDFHLVEEALRAILAPWHNRNLNEIPPFRAAGPVVHNPSAENVAAHIADELFRRLAGSLPRGAYVASVRVTEAAGCAATYRPPRPDLPGDTRTS